jgi:hypothetical protein
MKHPFLTLYYTGIGILLSIGVILTLVVINIPNISRAFTKETPAPKPYPESADVKVLQNIPTEKTKKLTDKEPVNNKSGNSSTREVNQHPNNKVEQKSDDTTVVKPPIVKEDTVLNPQSPVKL